MLKIGDSVFLPMLGMNGKHWAPTRVEDVTTNGVVLSYGEQKEWYSFDYLIVLGARKILTDEIKTSDSQRGNPPS